MVSNISKKLFLEIAQGRPYEVHFKTKKLKTIFAKYSDIAVNPKFQLKDYEGEMLSIFNEAGFLEIAVYKSNTSKHGSASSLLGLNYRDTISIEFKK